MNKARLDTRAKHRPEECVDIATLREPDEYELRGAKFILSQFTDNEEKNIRFLASFIRDWNLQFEEQQKALKYACASHQNKSVKEKNKRARNKVKRDE